MRKKVTFGQWEETTTVGGDFAISVPFDVVDSSLLGKPEQLSSTEPHLLFVSIGDIRQHFWGFDSGGLGLMKVLFEFGRREIERLIKSSALPREGKIVLKITVDSHPGDKCPFSPAMILEPAEATFEVDVESPGMGFHVRDPRVETARV